MSGHSGKERKGVTELDWLLFLAHHLRDSVPNDGACFFNLLLGQTNSDANLETGRNDLLRLEVVFDCLKAGDKDSIGKALDTITHVSG
jgi:hypothetical protein